MLRERVCRARLGPKLVGRQGRELGGHAVRKRRGAALQVRRAVLAGLDDEGERARGQRAPLAEPHEVAQLRGGARVPRSDMALRPRACTRACCATGARRPGAHCCVIPGRRAARRAAKYAAWCSIRQHQMLLSDSLCQVTSCAWVTTGQPTHMDGGTHSKLPCGHVHASA